MRGEVALAQVERRLGAEVAHRLEAAERLAREAPAAGRVEPTRERVHHGVEVGGNVETPDLGVITGVADHGERTPRDRGREAAQELRRARATGDRGQAHVTRAWLPAASRARCRRATPSRPSLLAAATAPQAKKIASVAGRGRAANSKRGRAFPASGRGR